jgi:NhaD family Na+/H+ antiporter
MRPVLRLFLSFFLLFLLPTQAWATDSTLNLHATGHGLAITACVIFAITYLIVMVEEFTHLRKSKPVILAAGIIWALVAWIGMQSGAQEAVNAAARHSIMEYAELFLFLLVAMAYINAMQERQVFEALRSALVSKGLSYKQLFWMTGFLAFFISPFADNLTTALLMCAIITAVGSDQPKFVSLSCINIVVAANAGGAFSPFGDITTLMVWQKGMLSFGDFFVLFVPSLVNFLVPAFCMQFCIPNEKPAPVSIPVGLLPGAKTIVVLFLLTIVTAVCFHHFLHLPPTLGMTTGFAYLKLFGFYLKITHQPKMGDNTIASTAPFDVFRTVRDAEWDTLLFFYGILLCVGGLATLGYLDLLSHVMYDEWGQSLPSIHNETPANIAIGLLSSIIDNIPIMFAVLTMNPSMSEGQWLLVTLTAGVGGSLFSIGSAAGVALMGQAPGKYTFFSHLKWTWAILLGYIASIITHIIFNRAYF